VKQWLPIPISEIEKIDNDRRLTDTPASTLDGFAFAYLKSYRGAPLSQRQLAQWAGWSKRKATDVLNAVQQCQQSWADQKRSKNGPAVGTKNEPDQSNDPAQLADSADQERTRSGPDPIQKRTDRARSYSLQLQLDPQLDNYDHAGTSPDSVPIEEKPKPKRKAQKTVGTKRTRALWAELNERRKERRPGAQTLKLSPGIHNALNETLKWAKEAEILRAYEWFTTSKDAEWWQDKGCDMSVFCRKKHLDNFISRSAEWNPQQEQHHTGPDLMDLDDSQFDEDGNIIEFQPNRSGTNGNE